jgi:hypothetical protein
MSRATMRFISTRPRSSRGTHSAVHDKLDGFGDVEIILDDHIDLPGTNGGPSAPRCAVRGRILRGGYVISNLTLDAFYGASDDGSDSLMRAGLFAALREDG